MPADSPLVAWILEAVDAAGRRASPLTVAKLVWSHHEQDLRARGDLLFTWQLDLRAAAAEMIADGRLLVDDADEWVLPEGVVVPGRRLRSWSDGEIGVAVTAYVDRWRAEVAGRPRSHDEVVADVATQVGRSVDQVEAMFANIAHVVQERGGAPLSGVRPRSNVPPGVRAAVAAALGPKPGPRERDVGARELD